MGKLDGKVAVITGGTSGIGAATAELFIAEGAKVLITGRSEDKGQAIVDQLGDNCAYFKADVMVEGDTKASIDRAVDQFGRLDILFNNAGGPVGGSVGQVDAAEVHRGVDQLLTHVVLGISAAIEPMKAAGGGSIINNASIAGHRYRQGSLLYSAIKAAVHHYTRLSAVELGPLGIRVNAISPGAIATPIFWGGSAIDNNIEDAESARKMEKLQANLAKATPTPRSGIAKDIAEGALYLASDAGSYVNGHDLVIDGGRIQMFNEFS